MAWQVCVSSFFFQIIYNHIISKLYKILYKKCRGFSAICLVFLTTYFEAVKPVHQSLLVEGHDARILGACAHRHDGMDRTRRRPTLAGVRPGKTQEQGDQFEKIYGNFKIKLEQQPKISRKQLTQDIFCFVFEDLEIPRME